MYKLHTTEKGLFLLSDILEYINVEFGIQKQLIEKDYYITAILYEIAELQKQGVKVYFKGGTSYYKTIVEMKRFSEDIDLTLDVTGLTDSGKKSLMKRVNDRFLSLPLDKNNKHSISGRGSRTSVYLYDTISLETISDRMDRIGNIKIETTTFTTNNPNNMEVIYPMFLKYLKDNKELLEILELEYGVHTFEIKVMMLERTFVDKIYALEGIFRNLTYGEKSTTYMNYVELNKHLYDIYDMYNNGIFQNLIEDKELFYFCIEQHQEELQYRIENLIQPYTMDILDFEIWNVIGDESKDMLFREGFNKMQETYIFQEEYLVTYEDAVGVIQDIYNQLSRLKGTY